MTIRYVTAPAAGNGSGSSWANGAAAQNMNLLVAASDPGDEIHVDSAGAHVMDGNTWTSTRLGGATEATRVKIMGINQTGTPGPATISGTLRPEPWVTGGAAGADLLKLESGIRFLHFKDLVFRRHGRVMEFRHADNTGFLIEDCKTYNTRNFLAQSGLCPALTNSTFQNLYSEGFTRDWCGLNGDSSNLVFRNCYGDSQYQDDGVAGTGSNGVTFVGTVHNVRFYNCTMRNGGRQEGAEYWNGDGFVTDNLNYDLIWENCLSEGWYDGGWDMKSYQTTMVDCTSRGNLRNFRLHSSNDLQLRRCKSLYPHYFGGSGSKCHIQIEHNAGQPFATCEAHIYDSLFVDDDPDTRITSHSGDGLTTAAFHNSLIKMDAASLVKEGGGTAIFDCTPMVTI